MSLLKKTLFFNKIARLYVVKYSISSSSGTEPFYFKSNFTEEEQTKVLNILNGSNSNQLSRFHISQSRIKNIESWKNKRGPFRSLGEVLEVDGLGEKLLHKMCEEIVNEKCDIVSEKKVLSENGVNNKRQKKQMVTPPVNGNIINNITSAVGVHLSPMGVSWAKLSRDQNTLVSWNFDNFSCLPNKMLPTDTFDKTVNIVRNIPPSDVYVFEANPSMSPRGQSSPSLVMSYAQQLELTAMLLALLNTSVDHNVTLQNINNAETPKSVENRVYFLRSKISARLFSTLVGLEKVAAITTINELLQSGEDSTKSALPCTPITVEQQLRNTFNSQSPPNKELLGQALMLVISFMDLCVYKNPISLSAVYNTNKKNKK